MMLGSGTVMDLVLVLIFFWATTGLTVIHLAVLGWRWLRGRSPKQRRTAAPKGPLPDLSLTFVVPVYNDGMTVGPTIESVLRQSVAPKRILVVNDGSTDDTAEVLETFCARGVEILHLEKNVGKVRALDAALKTIDTDLIAITDADSIVHVDYVKEMLESFRDPEIVGVGGAVESIPHTWVTAARQLEYMLTVHIDREAESAMNALVVLPGVSTTYRTSVLREMGFEYDTIAEDFDLTFRLQKAGHKITMNLNAKVYTSDPPTLRAYHRQLSRWYTDFWLVVRKHKNVLGKRTFGTVEVPMLILNATVSSVAYLIIPFYLFFQHPERLPLFFATGLAVDLVLVLIAWRAYRRRDVWLALASRVPTRFIARWAYVVAMVRVFAGRPGLAWAKLERRSNDAFFASGSPAIGAALPARTLKRGGQAAPPSAIAKEHAYITARRERSSEGTWAPFARPRANAAEPAAAPPQRVEEI